MINAYLDESQQTETQRHVVVAGFCGTEDQWNSFAPAWKGALGQRPFLHMSSLRWNAENAEKNIRPVLNRLGPIPYAHGLVPVYGAVKVSDYHDLVAHESVLEQRVKGYVVCLGTVLSVFMDRYPGHETINVVCEEQGQSRYAELARDLLKAFRQIGMPWHPYFETVRFVRKGAVPFTDPADFLAFAIGKRSDESGSKKDVWCRPIHPESYSVVGRVTLRMPRKKAREIIMQVMTNRRDGNARLWKEILAERP